MSETPSSPDPAASAGCILFVDDDPDVLKAAALALERRGFCVTTAAGPAEAWSVLAASPADVVLLDLNFSRGATSGEEGFQFLADLLALDPEAVVVVVTGHSGVNIAVAAMRAGASDFVMKPWRNDRLAETLQAAVALRRKRLEAARRTSGSPPADGTAPAVLLGDSPAMGRVRALIRRAAPTGASVMILGEAGTGKSLVARAIHLQSPRAAGPFVCVDFGSLSEDAAALALFGGPAAAGALADARGGTLVLDEAAEIPAPLQARLLAALDGPDVAQVRIVSTTRRPREAVRGRGGLREDLLVRLNTVEILVPPLRERGGDVLDLAQHFLRVFAQRYDRPGRALSPEAAEAIAAHAWPSEVRALRQAMERCVIFAEGDRYELADVTLDESGEAGAPPARAGLDLAGSERALILRALKANAFNVTHAARQLGLTRPALYRRMAKHGL